MKMSPFRNKIWLSSPTMHGDESKYVTETYEANWISMAGKNIDEAESLIADKDGIRFAVSLPMGMASL